MALLDSTTYTNQKTSATKISVDQMGTMQFARFSHVQSGAGSIGDVINLVELPAGKIAIYPDFSRLVTTAHGGTATTSVGLAAYANAANVPVAATPTALANATSTVSAVDAALSLPAAGFLVVDSRNGVVVQATNAGSAIPNAGTVEGWIAFVRG